MITFLLLSAIYLSFFCYDNRLSSRYRVLSPVPT